MAQEKKAPVQGVSRLVFFVTIAVVAAVGFTAGTRNDEILGTIGPVLGLRVESGQLDLKSVQSTYRKLKANYDGNLSEQKLIEGASRGMVAAAGDPYTVYMDAKESDEFDKDLTGNIGGGIGAEIGVREGNPTVIRVLDDNAAEKAGVKAGDTIVAVNDEVVAGWTPDKVASAIRGEVGTTVKLALLRANEPVEIAITRATVNNPSVVSGVENGIGMLTISRFDDGTSRLVKSAAEQFAAQKVRGVILDLRGNGGGYLTAAQEVAGIWLNDKVIVSERANGRIVDELKSGDDAILAGVPTVVLVNGSSASASEIVAGALQDHGAATLVGEKTFGKGSVQKLLDLGAGTKLKVTVARWYTPKGKNITKEGIKPNQAVDLTAADTDAGRDPQKEAAVKKLNG